MYYGGTDPEKQKRRYVKHYNYDGTFEIKHDRTTGQTQFYIYLGGDAYSAPAVLSVTDDSEKYLYLHRDYLGSITLITNNTGNAIERRHFDAWGNITNYWNAEGKTTIPAEGILLDRGYTGHEHLLSVGLIHMNARLYDPVLHRFLQPDNYVQDLFNTQNFNRYGYVLNNPLLYTDPTGEYILVDDIVAAVFGGIINLTVNAIQGNLGGHGFWGGVGRGFAAFGAGALAGWGALYPEFGGWLWGGGVVGATNAWLGGATKAEDIALGAGIGVVSSVVGGAVGHVSSKYIGGILINGMKVSSPILQGTIKGVIGGSVGGYTAGLSAGLILTGDWEVAHEYGWKGALTGAPIGAISGGVSAYRYSIRNNIDPWNGQEHLYEISDGVRRAKAAQMLGKETINVMDNSGKTFEVPIKNLRSPYKKFIDISTMENLQRFNNVYELTKIKELLPIYVNKGNRGIPINEIYFKK